MNLYYRIIFYFSSISIIFSGTISFITISTYNYEKHQSFFYDNFIVFLFGNVSSVILLIFLLLAIRPYYFYPHERHSAFNRRKIYFILLQIVFNLLNFMISVFFIRTYIIIVKLGLLHLFKTNLYFFISWITLILLILNTFFANLLIYLLFLRYEPSDRLVYL